jgi:uncharacterized protein affecting Mg2+/Co2+ transport
MHASERLEIRQMSFLNQQSEDDDEPNAFNYRFKIPSAKDKPHLPLV